MHSLCFIINPLSDHNLSHDIVQASNMLNLGQDHESLSNTSLEIPISSPLVSLLLKTLVVSLAWTLGRVRVPLGIVEQDSYFPVPF